MLHQRQRLEKNRLQRQRMHRREQVVGKTRQRQVRRPRPAARLILPLHHQHGPPGPRQRDGRREPIGPRANHHRIMTLPRIRHIATFAPIRRRSNPAGKEKRARYRVRTSDSSLEEQPLASPDSQGDSQTSPDPILARLVKAWPSLSEERKKIIGSLLETV
jgi:hypothetical protein